MNIDASDHVLGKGREHFNALVVEITDSIAAGEFEDRLIRLGNELEQHILDALARFEFEPDPEAGMHEAADRDATRVLP